METLSNFELIVMLATIRLDDGAYGVSISDELERVTSKEVLVGRVYDALARLEQRGWIRSELGEATPERGGRAKRYFQPTSKGLRAVRDTRRALVELWNGAPKLKGQTG